MTKIGAVKPPSRWLGITTIVAGGALGLLTIRGCVENKKDNTPIPQTQNIQDEIPDKDGLFLSTVDQVLTKTKLGKVDKVFLWVSSEKPQNTPYYEFILKSGNRNYLLVPIDPKEVQRLENGLRTLSPSPIDITKGGKSSSDKTIDTIMGLTSLIFPVILLLLLFPIIKSFIRPGRSWKIEDSDKKFSDVRGYPRIIERLDNLVKYVKDVEKNKVGANIPKGVLLVGPPGTGKTLMAKAVAGEAKVPIIVTSGSDFMNTPLVGVATKKVEGLFDYAEKIAEEKGGCIIFIDEIDALGSIRGNIGSDVGHEHSKTLTKVLERMDGFKPMSNVMIIGATNRPEVLDPALKRPGRFEIIIEVPPPISIKQIEDILDIYLNEKQVKGQLAPDITVQAVAQMVEGFGFSGADLKGLVDRAALLAFEKRQDQITMDNINKAISEIAVGMEHGELVKEVDRWVTAVHEVGGHELVGLACKREVEAVSMVPRGKALGHVRMSNIHESTINPSKINLLKDILCAMAGRASEKAFLPSEHYTLGAMGDLQQVRKIVKLMLTAAMFPGHGSTDYMKVDYLNQEKELSEEDKKILDQIIDRAVKVCMTIIDKFPKNEVEILIKRSLEAGELNREQAKTLWKECLLSGNWEEAYKIVDEFTKDPFGTATYN